MVKREDITGIVLAGGQSRRMGSDKAMLEFRGKKLIEFSLAVMQEVAGTTIISANHGLFNSLADAVVADTHTGIGPLGGLEAGLRVSRTRVNLVAPCDTPFLSVVVLRHILDYVETYDAVVPISADGKIEPLTAYYSRDVLPVIERQIKQGDYKMQHLLQNIRTKYLLIDGSHVLKNMNTPDDFSTFQLNAAD